MEIKSHGLSVPQNYTFNKKTGIIIYDSDLTWEGDFNSAEANSYYPNVDGIIEGLQINGNFQIKGNLRNIRENSGLILSFKINGDISANSLYFDFNSVVVNGNTYAKRYICLRDIDIKEGFKAEFNKLIDTPLFIVSDYMIFKHRGGFSDNCTIISDYPLPHVSHKVHTSDSLIQDIVKTKDYFDPRLIVDKLIEQYESGKSVFHDNYDPDSADPIEVAQEIFDTIEQDLKEGKYKDAQKKLKTINLKDIEYYPQIAIYVAFYEVHIYIRLDKEKFQKAIEKNCKLILKQIKDCPSQLSWDILLYATDYIAYIHENKGEYAKALSLINQYNRGDEAHYVRKVNLLLKLGKEKDALFPAYIAIMYYKTNQLNDFAKSDIYKKYVEDNNKKFSVPKGYKTSYQSSLQKLRSLVDIDFGDEDDDSFNPVVYKGDVYWNSDLIAVEDTNNYFKEGKNTIVVLGDLFIVGRLDHYQIDIFVQGNIFCESVFVSDAKLECTGNVFANKEIVLKEDIGGAVTFIYGNVKTPILAADSEELRIFGKIDSETVCVGFNGYEFDDVETFTLYTDENLSDQVDLDDVYGGSFYEHLMNGTLLN